MPRVAIITTGGELIALSAVPQTGQIRDSNGPMLAAMVQALGLPAPATTHVADDLGQIGAALRAAAAADVILLAGGVSAGKYDLVPRAVADYGARLVFHKVRQKPGKPLLFAVRGHQLIFGLSGNPLGCHLGMHRYVGPALRRLRGEGQPLPTDSGALAGALAPKGSRTHFVLGRATRPDPYGPWRLEPLPTVSSADIFGPWQANCYIEAPPGREPLATGTLLRFSWI
jgi:molybdopterin molybdotransferase